MQSLLLRHALSQPLKPRHRLRYCLISWPSFHTFSSPLTHFGLLISRSCACFQAMYNQGYSDAIRDARTALKDKNGSLAKLDALHSHDRYMKRLLSTQTQCPSSELVCPTSSTPANDTAIAPAGQDKSKLRTAIGCARTGPDSSRFAPKWLAGKHFGCSSVSHAKTAMCAKQNRGFSLMLKRQGKCKRAAKNTPAFKN